MQLPQENPGVIYEVNLEADADIAGPFDTWLRDHIADMLQFEGFRSAEIFDDPAAPAGRIRRIVQYRLRNQAALDDYLATHAPRMRAQGVARFGNRAADGGDDPVAVASASVELLGLARRVAATDSTVLLWAAGRTPQGTGRSSSRMTVSIGCARNVRGLY